jgi:hypothetical protein
MNKENSPRIVHCIAAVFGVITLISSNIAIAKDADKADLTSQHIEGLEKEVVGVRLIYLPVGTLFRSRADEKTLGAVGCIFRTDDKPLINNLISIITDGQVAHSEKTGLIETRYGLYFTRRDGFETKILFDKAYTNSKQTYGLIDNEAIEADPALPERLVNWAKDSGLKQENAMCKV